MIPFLLMMLPFPNDQIVLLPTLRAGYQFNLEETQRVSIRYKKGNEQTDSVLDLTMDVKHHVKEPRPKQFTIERQWSRVRVNNPNTIGGRLSDMFKAFDGAVFTIEVDEKGTVRKVDGYEALLKRLKDKQTEWASQVEAMIPREMCYRRQSAFLDYLPGKPVSVGESWKRQEPEQVATLRLDKVNRERGGASILGEIKSSSDQSTLGSYYIVHDFYSNRIVYLEEKMDYKKQQGDAIIEITATLILRLQ